MKRNYFLGDKKLWPDEIPVPETGEYNVLIRVTTCGTCGTDVHIYCGSKGPTRVHPPVILGHELVGAVERTGSAVTTAKSGNHVIVDPSNYCGKCHYRKIGKKQICESLYAVGVSKDGGFAQHCAVPETQCYQPDKEIPLKYGAMTEPLACYIHGTDRIGLMPGNTVCVTGGGAIGLVTVQLAKLLGASKMVPSEPVPMRREIGTKAGTDAVIDPVYEEIGQRLIKILGTSGVDVVIKRVGIPAAAEQALKAADKGATILFFSVPSPGSTYAMYLEEIFQKELTIVGLIISPDTHGRIVTLINGNAVQPEPLITYLSPLDQLEQVIPAQQSLESTRVIVEP